MALTHNLTKALVTVRSINATAAGTSTITGAGVDTLGFSACRAVVCMGTLTATQATRVHLENSDDNITWFVINNSGSGYAADADSNKILITDLYKPQRRYVRMVIDRGTANAVIDSGVLELWLADRQPVTQDATVSQAKVIDNQGTGTA